MRDQRDEIAEILAMSPALKFRRDDSFERASRRAKQSPAKESGLAIDVFPASRPFSIAQAEDDSFWLGAAALIERDKS